MRAKIKINPSDVLRIMDKADVQSVLPRLRGNKFVNSRGFVESVGSRKVQEIPRAIAVNRKYIGAIKSLAESGEIPKKDASRMIRAIRYQNTIDTMPILPRVILDENQAIRNARMAHVGKTVGFYASGVRKKPRPTSGKTVLLVGKDSAGDTKLYGKRRGNMYRVTNRFYEPAGYSKSELNELGYVQPSSSNIVERIANLGLTEVPRKYKAKKPSAERMIRDTKQKLKMSALLDLNDAFSSPSAGSYKRKPRNRSEKIVEQMANKYRDMRNMVKSPNGTETVDMRLLFPKKKFSDNNVDVYAPKFTPDDIIL